MSTRVCISPASGITRVGHLSRTYAELAGRTAPTATDVEAALADCRLSAHGLEEYTKRPERRHVQKREKLPLSLFPPTFLKKGCSVLLCCSSCAACVDVRTRARRGLWFCITSHCTGGRQVAVLVIENTLGSTYSCTAQMYVTCNILFYTYVVCLVQHLCG